MAIVTDGLNSELITYSDIRWQLALQPGKPLSPPTKADIDEALRITVEQRIFALEAERIPRNAPADDEIKAEIQRLLDFFPSPADFERRLRMVGFTSVADENFQRLIAKRLAIEKYIDFRFRSFVVITRTDEDRYYSDVYVPNFRRTRPGVLVPNIEEVRTEITGILTDDKILESITSFLDEARIRVDVTYFNGI